MGIFPRPVWVSIDHPMKDHRRPRDLRGSGGCTQRSILRLTCFPPPTRYCRGCRCRPRINCRPSCGLREIAQLTLNDTSLAKQAGQRLGERGKPSDSAEAIDSSSGPPHAGRAASPLGNHRDLPDRPRSPMAGALRTTGPQLARRTCRARFPEVIEMQSEAGAGRRAPRRASEGRAWRRRSRRQPGPAADDPEHVQDRGRADAAGGHPRRGRGPIATHALSIFGDHSDVDARAQPPAGRCSLAALSRRRTTSRSSAHAATLASRVPFLHFFDGFRTCARGRQDRAAVETTTCARWSATRTCSPSAPAGMTPDAPVVRGTAQNPDVFFQAREAANPFHLARARHRRGASWPSSAAADRPPATASSTTTARRTPERVVIVMGSAAGAVEETVDALVARRRAGRACVTIRLFNPFPLAQSSSRRCPRRVTRDRGSATGPRSRAPSASRSISTTVAALAEAMDRDDPPFARHPRVIGGRYGLVVQGDDAVDDQADLRRARPPRPKRHFTVGIYDDVTHLSLPIDARRSAGSARRARSRRSSSGSARTARSAPTRRRSRSSARARTCSPRATSSTTPRSRARSPCPTCALGPSPSGPPTSSRMPTSSPATSSDCSARPRSSSSPSTGATFLLNAPYGPDEVWEHLPGGVQQLLIDKEIDFWVIDAVAVADEAGMGSRINTVMQPCFFQLAGILPPDEAISRIKGFVEKTYAKRGEAIVARNFAAIDRSLERLGHVALGGVTNNRPAIPPVPDDVPDFVARITSRLMAGDGDLLPVSALPVDGTFPSGTAQVREARDRPDDPDLGPVDLHRLRQVRDGLPARDDPDEGLPDGRGRGGASRLPPQGIQIARAARAPAHDPGRARRLHRLRRLRRRLPGEEQDRLEPQGDQHGADRPTTATSSAGAGTSSSRSRRSIEA